MNYMGGRLETLSNTGFTCNKQRAYYFESLLH